MLDFATLSEAGAVSRNFHELSTDLEEECYERTMRRNALNNVQRRLETQAYVDALDEIEDADRQVAFDAGFHMVGSVTYRLAFLRGFLLCVLQSNSTFVSSCYYLVLFLLSFFFQDLHVLVGQEITVDSNED
jgi:hypothetical protein